MHRQLLRGAKWDGGVIKQKHRTICIYLCMCIAVWMWVCKWDLRIIYLFTDKKSYLSSLLRLEVSISHSQLPSSMPPWPFGSWVLFYFLITSFFLCIPIPWHSVFALIIFNYINVVSSYLASLNPVSPVLSTFFSLKHTLPFIVGFRN